MAEAEGTEAKKPKGKTGLIIVLLLVVLLLGGGGAAAVILLRSSGAARASEEKKSGHERAEGDKAAKAGDKGERGVLSLESFIANLADPEGERYIKCTMRLEIDDRQKAEKLKLDELAITKIRDRILTLLTSKTYAQVASSEGKDSLRTEIAKELEPILEGGHISGVYYTEFIVQ